MSGTPPDHGIPPALINALSGLDPHTVQAITEVIVLHREFPEWAAWLPDGSRRWVAVRVASARAPSPEVPLIWVAAGTAAELGARMRRANAGLSPG